MIVFNDTYKFCEGDFDLNDNLKASSILDLFQTVASVHAREGGFGFDEMIARNIAWVITKIKFDCYAPIKVNQPIFVESIPQPKGLADYVRDHYLYDENGNLIVKGSSQWVLIDFTTRRIVRPCVDFVGEFSTKKAYENRRIEKVEPTTAVYHYDYPVRAIDIDHNGHLNNIRYADIVFNCENATKPIKRFIINFINEAKLGQTLACYGDGEKTYSAFIEDKPCFSAFIEREDF